MRPPKDIAAVLQQTLMQECKTARSVRAEMNALFPAYYKYLQLDRQMEASRRRMSHILGLLGPDQVEETMNIDKAACLVEALKDHRSPQELREGLRLWIAVREYLRAVPGKSKVGDIQSFLTWIGIKNVTRQAIESALKQHRDSFQLSTKDHERYVGLKKKAL